MKKNILLLIAVFLAITLTSYAQQKYARGVDTDFWGSPTLSDYREAKSAGFDYVELDPGVYGHGSLSEIVSGSQATKELLDQAGLKVWSIHLPYGNSYDISVPDDATRNGIVARLKDYIKALAKVFSPSVMVLHPSGEPIPDSEREQRIVNACASVGELQTVADEAGVLLCVENLPRTCLGNTPEELLRIVEPNPGVRVCFDTNHYLKGSTEHFIKTIGHLIGTVHASDYDYTNEKHWLPTYGKVAWGELMVQLEAAGYDGVFMGEAEQLPEGTPTISNLKDSYDKIFTEFELVKADPAKRTELYLDGVKRQYFEDCELTAAFVPGTAPGCYPQAAVDAFSNAYNAARSAVGESHSAEEYAALRQSCYATLEQLKTTVLPMVEGWYFIVSGHKGFADRNKTMAMYNNSGILSWGPLEEKASFLFKVTKLDNGLFSIQNGQTECYINTVDGTSSQVPVSETHQTDQIITPFGMMGQFSISNTKNSLPYHTAGHSDGAGNGGAIVTWSGVAGSGSSWTFQPVDDETVQRLLANKEEMAKLPEVSTSADPQWYYIQIVGEEDRADRVYTLEGAKDIHGRYIINSEDDAELGRQLWRFEKNAAGRYIIYNKLTGKRLTLEYDSDQDSGCAKLSTTSSITFELKRAGNYFQVIGSQAAAGTNSGEVYLHQGNSGTDYCIITTGSYYGASINSMCRFVPFEDFRIAYSDDIEETWYTLANCGAAYSGLVIKEEQDGTASTLVLAEAADGDYASQWKAVKPADGGVQWVNRQTGNSISAVSRPANMFNILSTAIPSEAGNAWTATYLGSLQYAFSSIEDDQVERYMGANAEQAETPEVLDLKKILNSPHAWNLNRIESVPVSVGSVEGISPRVRVVNRRIFVDGCDDFSVYTVLGIRVPSDRQQQPGLYVVSFGNKSAKINIQ